MKTRLDLFSDLAQSDDKFEDFEQAIPLMSEEEEKALIEALVPESLPILPLKNLSQRSVAPLKFSAISVNSIDQQALI